MFQKITLVINQKISPNLRKILGNIIWLVADSLLQIGLSLVVGIWVARYLGPERYGLMNYVFAFVSLFTPFAKLGLENIVIRNITRSPDNTNETLGTALVLRLIGALFVFLLTISIGLFNRSDPLTIALIALSAGTGIFDSFETINFWFRSQVQAKDIVIGRNIVNVLMAIARFLLVAIKAPLLAFVWISLANSFLLAVSQVIVYRLHGQLIKNWRWSKAIAQDLLRDSWPQIFTGLVIMIYMRIDQIMLGQMVGANEVGIYSVAVRLAEMWYFIPNAIIGSVFPSLVKSREVSEKVYYERLETLFNYMSALSYSVAIPTTFLASWIITLLFGQNYAAAGPILSISIWGGVFVCLGLARGPWIITENFMAFSTATSLFGAITNIILNLFLIKKYGGIGAAIATVISQFVASYFANLVFSKTRKIFILQTKSLLLLNLIKKGLNFVKQKTSG